MDSIRRQRRPRFFSRALRRILGQAAPGQPALAGIPAVAAEQDLPVRNIPSRQEPNFDSSLEPAVEPGRVGADTPPDPPPPPPEELKNGFR